MIATVVGSGTSIPTRERGSPCFHIQVEEEGVMIDAGSGSLRQLARLDIDLRSIGTFLLTHFHPDHTADVVPFLFAMKNPEMEASGRVTIGGPEGIEDFFSGLERIYGDWMRPDNVEVSIVTCHPGCQSRQGWTLRSARTGHTPESLAYRVEWNGKSVVYSGDTPYSEGVISLAKDADLLVLECSFPEGPERKGHLIPSQAGEMAQRAGAQRLLLTHFYPAAYGADLVTPCAARFDGEILIAEDGLAVTV